MSFPVVLLPTAAPFAAVCRTLVLLMLFSAGMQQSCVVASAGESRPSIQATTEVDWKQPVVQVGKAIKTLSDLHALAAVEGIPLSAIETRFEELQALLTERTLVRQFLETQKLATPQGSIDRFLGVMKQRTDSQEQWQELLGELGTTQEQLVDQYTTKILWLRYIEKRTDDQELIERFQANQPHFDGTKVTARQIYLPQTLGEPEATAQLQQIRSQVLAGEFTFEQAAQQFSKSPSAAQGGLLGTFPYNGRMPLELTSICFGLKADEISSPVKTSFGYHLMKVDAILPGPFSFEDVRRNVLADLAETRWQQMVTKLRRQTKVVTFGQSGN